MKTNDNRRWFVLYPKDQDLIADLLREIRIKPIPGQRGTSRDSVWRDRDYILDETHKFSIRREDWTTSGNTPSCRIFCDDLHAVYKAFAWMQREVNRRRKAVRKDIAEPVLPAKTLKFFQDTVFDYYDAINAMDCVKGFGNVGIVLQGPAGVGKTETMRWVAETARQEYNKSVYQLSYSGLMEALSEKKEISFSDSLILIDDIDIELLKDRRLEEHKHVLTSQFLTCLDGMDKIEGRVMIISTNQKIDKMDPALSRPGRFEHQIDYTYPDMELIEKFCEVRKIEMNPYKFEGWSFARIDMFFSRHKVAEFRYGSTIDGFYEEFIAKFGETDPTVDAYAEGSEKTWD